MWTAPFQLLCSSSGVLNRRQLPTQFPHYGQKYWFLLQPSAAANEVNMSDKSPIWPKQMNKQTNKHSLFCWRIMSLSSVKDQCHERLKNYICQRWVRLYSDKRSFFMGVLRICREQYKFFWPATPQLQRAFVHCLLDDNANQCKSAWFDNKGLRFCFSLNLSW